MSRRAFPVARSSPPTSDPGMTLAEYYAGCAVIGLLSYDATARLDEIVGAAEKVGVAMAKQMEKHQ